ncbi:MAG: T9SS type A sorting domain-containing protein [Bacteroidetes bacterium]|nr:T9SS type A sorting domain-containing protein [Bacteroidota bacterium]
MEYKIMDAASNIVVYGTIINENDITINCSHWKSGIYLLEIRTQKGIQRKKLVVLRE